MPTPTSAVLGRLSGDNGRFNMLAQILRARPTAGLRMTDEELLASSIDPLELESSESLSQVNPIKQAESVINTTKTEMWSGNLALNIDFGKGWTFRTAGTYNTSNARNYVFYQDGSKEAYRNGQTPYGSTRMTRNVRWTNFNYLTYKYKRNKGHAFDVMLGQETSFQGTEYLLAGATDFPFDNLANNNLGLGATPTTANRTVRTRCSFRSSPAETTTTAIATFSRRRFVPTVLRCSARTTNGDISRRSRRHGVTLRRRTS